MADGEEQKHLELQAKFKSSVIPVLVSPESTVGQLKQALFALTNVQVDKQKLVGLVCTDKAQKLDDNTVIGSLTIKKNTFMLIGNPDEEILKDLNEEDYASIVDDLDVDYSAEETKEMSHNPEHLRLMTKYTEKLHINIINPPRPGKKLLVLDLDYTIFDMKGKGDFVHLKRPFTDQFLSLLYPFYDIVFWSQTSWKWLEIKLTELGILLHPNYRVCFVLDKTCMFSIESKKGKYQVKALQLIWNKFPEWGPANTVHVDDLGRNFAMNPQSGLKILPYKDAPNNRATDRELQFVGRYLYLLKELNDFTVVDHSKWKESLAQHADKLPATLPFGI